MSETNGRSMGIRKIYHRSKRQDYEPVQNETGTRSDTSRECCHRPGRAGAEQEDVAPVAKQNIRNAANDSILGADGLKRRSFSNIPLWPSAPTPSHDGESFSRYAPGSLCTLGRHEQPVRSPLRYMPVLLDEMIARSQKPEEEKTARCPQPCLKGRWPEGDAA